MNLPAVRLYGEAGCPYCERAAQFFVEHKIPLQAILVDEDPVIREGIKFISKQPDVRIPVVVSFLNPKEVILGYSESGYQRIAEAYRAFIGASAGDFSVSVGADPGAAENLAQASAPVSEAAN